jgi:hypothetical protein
MKTLSLSGVFAGMLLLIGNDPSHVSSPPNAHDVGAAYSAPVAAEASAHPSSPPVARETLTQVVQRYCVVCHNQTMLTGNLSLEDFSVEHAPDQAETAEKMIRKLRAGMMPPPGMPRPSGDTLLTLAETLESDLDEVARAQLNVGVRRFQRLNQTEYERVIRDLLGLEVDAGKWLPPDVLVGSFDNMSAAQGLSTTLLDSYLRAAADVSRLALGNPDVVSSTTKHKNALEVSQHAWDHIEGAPFGTRGGIVVTHDFPSDGEYVFQVETTFGSGNATAQEDIDISIDGEPVAFLMLEHNAGSTISAIRTEPIFVRSGQRRVSAAFVNLIDGPYEDRFSPAAWSTSGTALGQYGVTGLTHLSELLITGPDNVTGVSETTSRRKVFTCYPTAPAEGRPCAESILTALATQAYRRPPPRTKVAKLMDFYDEAASEGGFEVGVRAGLQAILVSPEFLFRLEREPTDVGAGEVYRLTDHDLASRLSFFLWESAPDDELLEVAEGGRLSEPAVLEEQLARMLADGRSETLATRFAHQWLRLQDVGKVWPEAYLYPDFSQQLAEAMVRETEMLFQYLVQEDRSLLELFSADYTFLNERLAQHYGIEGVSGQQFRRVNYPNEQRRGVLGHASVLNLTSMSARTSPVLRGKWVMEVLMGTPPPPPPPNVPTLDESSATTTGRLLTTRERMELHRANPVCVSCHSFIDPIGLALDNFDVTGAWRIRENNAPLDTEGTFYDGTVIGTPSQLVEVLLKRPIPLVRNFTELLLTYAIGRPTNYLDQPTIRMITQSAETNDYRMSSLIKGIVMSDPFQMRQTETRTDDSGSNQP